MNAIRSFGRGWGLVPGVGLVHYAWTKDVEVGGHEPHGFRAAAKANAAYVLSSGANDMLCCGYHIVTCSAIVIPLGIAGRYLSLF